MQSLILKTTSTQVKEFELPIPFFARSKDCTEYMAVLDEKTHVSIFHTKNLTTIQNGIISEYTKQGIAKAWETWVTCTESEFLEKYDQVIESISLHPILVR